MDEVQPTKHTLAIVDTETTGGTFRDELIEIGVVVCEVIIPSGGVVECCLKRTYSSLRQPNVPITYGAFCCHGISEEQLQGHDLDYEFLRETFSQVDAIIAHNARFDRKFVAQLFPLVQTKVWLCSVSGIAWKKRGLPSRALQKLLAAHEISVAQAHRALDDAMNLYRLISTPYEEEGPYVRELVARIKTPSATKKFFP